MPANSVLYMATLSIAPNRQEGFAHELQIDLAAAGNSAAVIIPQGVRQVAVQVDFATSGTGKVQASIDPVSVIKTGTPTWVDWDAGTVAVATQSSCVPVTAIRAVQVHSGTMKMTIRAQ